MLEFSFRQMLLHLLVLILAFGPVAGVTAAPLAEEDCAPTCGCDDAHEHQGDDIEAADDCEDECPNCDCKSAVMVGVVPMGATPLCSTQIAEQAEAPPSARVSRLGDDIFIPPRR